MISDFHRRVLDELGRTVDRDDPQWPQWRDRVASALARVSQAESEAGSEMPLIDPQLPGGTVVSQSVIAYGKQFLVPSSCHLQQSLFATGRVEIGRNSRVDGVVVAGELVIGGGSHSQLNHLVAETLRFESAPAEILGHGWCASVAWRGEAGFLPPQLRVRGVVSVQEESSRPLIVQAHSEMGGLLAKSDVQSEAHCRIGHLRSEGRLTVGRDNAIGRVEGGEIVVPHDSSLTAVISRGDLSIQGVTQCDTIRARGDITLGPDVTITGPVVIAEEGRFRFPVGRAWHTRRDHWFFEAEDGMLTPVRGGVARPAGSRLIALQALNHALWEQMKQLRGAAA